MTAYASVIKDLKIPELDAPIRAGERLEIRFQDPENPDDNGIAYKDDQPVCDIPSLFSEEYLQIVVDANEKHTVTHHTDDIRVIQTEHGFLDDCIDEGICQEDGVPNYGFTDNPNHAAVFYTDSTVPKYLGVSPHKKLLTAQECADYVGGKLVTIRVTKTITWEIID